MKNILILLFFINSMLFSANLYSKNDKILIKDYIVHKNILDMEVKLRNKIQKGIVPNKKESMNLYNEVTYNSKYSQFEKLLGTIPIAYMYKENEDELKYKFLLSDLITSYKFNFKEINDVLFLFRNTYIVKDFLDNRFIIESEKNIFISINKLKVKSSLKRELQYLYFINRYIKSSYKKTDEQKDFNDAKHFIARTYTYLSLEMANLFYIKSNYLSKYSDELESTISYAKQSLEIFKEVLNNREFSTSLKIARIYEIIGSSYLNLSNIKESNKYLLLASKIYEKNKIYKKYIEILNLIIINNTEMKNMKDANYYMNKALKISKDKIGNNSVSYANTLAAKANVLVEEGDYELAIESLNEAKKIIINEFGEYSTQKKILDSSIRYITNKFNKF